MVSRHANMRNLLNSFSIRTRLVILFVLQIVLIMGLGGVYLDWQVRQTLEDELAANLENLARAAALQIDPDLLLSLTPGDEQTRTYRNIKSQLAAFKQETDLRRVYIFSTQKRSLVDTDADILIGWDYAFLPLARSELDSLFSGASVSSTLFTGSDGKLYKTGFAAILSGGQVIAGLAAEGSARTLEAIQTVRRDLLLLGGAVLVIAVLLGLFFSKRLTIPLNRLRDAAQNIAGGDYESKISIQSRDEVGFLAETMEKMRQAIVQRDTRQKAMLASVAHEIRNPLGGIELFAGLLASELTEKKAKGEAQKIQKEVQNLKKIVSDFLNFARPNKARREAVAIKLIFEEAQMLMAEEFRSVDCEFHESQPNTHAFVDPQHLKRILLNLMKNSVEAMNGNGKIRLEVAKSQGRIELTLTDNGPGIDEKIRDQIFEPFFTKRKDGTGLGLAIVKSLAEENGGDIRVGTTVKGAVFHLRFAMVVPSFR